MALSLREREFINMARFSGANTFDIILREIFPYVYAYMMVGFINTILFAVNTEATLAVIGLSKVEVPTLGSIIFWALNYNALFTGQISWLIAPIVSTVILFLGLFLTSTGYNAAFADATGCCMIRLKNVVATYTTQRGQVNAVDGVTLEIPDGCHSSASRANQAVASQP